tara:strand:- start:211 stop:456 length:246 start_codon:yes stop_codon:yes gene_type:complete
MNEVYNDLDKLEKIKHNIRCVNPLNRKSSNLLLDTVDLMDEMIREKEQILEIHKQELRIQGARELVTEIFGSAMANKMGVI